MVFVCLFGMDVVLPDFSIEQIANSGQCFRIFKNNFKNNSGAWTIYHQTYCLNIKHLFNAHYDVDCSNEEWQNVWHTYFDLNTNYNEIKQIIFSSDDLYLQKATEFSTGVRILRQELLETIISFIISQNNNIPRITKTINSICTPYFPTILTLASLSINDWHALGVGYRAKYLYEVAQKICDGTFNLDELKTMDYKMAILYLKKLNGVGDKVANCIALFGLHHMEAFPQDVWIKRIIAKHYRGSSFPIERYHKWLGVVQQYMYYYERMLKNMERTRNRK